MMLHKAVDGAIAKVLDGLDARNLSSNTIVVFTSDHGEMLGSHGGMMQKWYTAFDEAIHIPLCIRGPGIPKGVSLNLPTSHIDLLPTLLGLAGVAGESAQKVAAAVSATHTEAHPLPGRSRARHCFILFHPRDTTAVHPI